MQEMRCKYCNSKLSTIEDVHGNLVLGCINTECSMVVRTKKHFLDEKAVINFILKEGK